MMRMSTSDMAEPLLVDLSPAPSPDDASVRAWAADQSVFVSSVIGGMKAERRAAADAIASVGAEPVLFENFGGMDDDAEDAYLGNVAASDIYLGILGVRYGTPLKSGYSATHAEYEEALRRGLRISVWVTDDPLDGPQRDFLEAVRVFHTTGSYSSPDDLAERVERRLRAIAAESIAPWVKVGNTIFRATDVTDDGTTVTVRARIRDNTVAASLEARRPSQGFGRYTDTRVTWRGGTTAVRVTEVRTEVGAGKARNITLIGNRIDGNQSNNMLDMGFNDMSPEEITELAMRVSLFGEPNPLGSMEFLIRAENPLPALESLGVSEDAFAQVAELLLTEMLVGGRGVDHITTFHIGPKHRGQRQMLLGWMPRRRYVNVQPVERRITGRVRLG